MSLSQLLAQNLESVELNSFKYDADQLSLESVDPLLFFEYNGNGDGLSDLFKYRFNFVLSSSGRYDQEGCALAGIVLDDPITGWSEWALISQQQRVKILNTEKKMAYGYGPSCGIEQRRFAKESILSSKRVWLRGSNVAGVSGIGGEIVNSDHPWMWELDWRYMGGRGSQVSSINDKNLNLSYAGTTKTGEHGSLRGLVLLNYEQRDQRAMITQSTAKLADNNLYNPAWGWLDGGLKNSREKSDARLFGLLEYSHKINDHSLAALTLSVKGGFDSSNYLSWFNTIDPRPDYYRYLPGFAGDLFTDELALLQWRADPQIDWDAMRGANIMAGGEAMYIMESRVRIPKELQANLNIVGYSDRRLDVVVGARARYNSTESYKVVDDLLGAQYHLDIDHFLVDDTFVAGRLENDIRDSHNRKLEGDRFGYDYDLTSRQINIYGDMTYRFGRLIVGGMIAVGGAESMRNGRFEKELFSGNGSYGESALVKFSTILSSVDLSYHLSLNQRISMTVSSSLEPPAAESIFINPEYRNKINDDSREVKYNQAEVNYSYIGGIFRVEIDSYASMTTGESRTYSYYDDLEREYCDLFMYDIKRGSLGVELRASVGLGDRFTLDLGGSLGAHRYLTNASADINHNTASKMVVTAAEVNIADYHVGDVANTMVTSALRYNFKLTTISVSGSIVDGRYLDPTPLRRMSRISTLFGQGENYENMIAQERLPIATSVDLYMQRTFAIGDNYLTLYCSLSNILNNRDNVYMGYEPMRVRRVGSGDAANYIPMESYKLYGLGCTIMVGASYKFR